MDEPVALETICRRLLLREGSTPTGDFVRVRFRKVEVLQLVAAASRPADELPEGYVVVRDGDGKVVFAGRGTAKREA